MPHPTIRIAALRLPEEIGVARGLFQEYTDGLGIDLSFQNLAAELNALPGQYAPPGGQILLARDVVQHPVGCVAMRPLAEAGACEMKRLYVRPEARGCALGRRLAQAIIACAAEAGYARMRLDTLGSMQAAQALYSSLGFRPTAAYYDSPVVGTIYLALDL
jgi:ribosomal protein S18 acetylase RimI-like enzyme